MLREKVALFIPTYNAGKEFEQVLSLIDEQDSFLEKKYIIDSTSKDETVQIAKNHNFEVKVIPSIEFNHGKTRTQAACDLADFDYIIYMTQDIYLQKNAIKELVEYIKLHPNMGVAYGKQEVDLSKGNIFEHRARTFNYPEKSLVKTKEDAVKLGIKTVFSSDAFCVYDVNLLKRIGYFPNDLNFAEDVYVGSKFINAGFSIGYCAEAKVYHTHNHSLKEEFKRYRYIGGFHKIYPEIQKQFGTNTSEGFNLVAEEISYLIKNGHILKTPESICRNAAKYLGYKLAKY